MTGITHTVAVNVIDGTIRVDLPNDDDTAAWDDLAEPDGGPLVRSPSTSAMTDLAAEPEWWGVAEAASYCGILPGTWRDYVARGRAPQPDDPDEGAPKERRRPRWRADTVRAWQASRPRPRRREGGTP